ncbi:hypothetical protein EPO66_04025 [bacterium]|nr:MAG: hypothetical protein EPO66_04025 [bacterium]
MIVPMKKATIIVQDKDAEAAMFDLRRLGLLHVEHHRLPQGKEINTLQEELALVNNVLDIFSAAELTDMNYNRQKTTCHDWEFTAKHAIDLWKRYDQLEVYSENLNNQISDWERWGDFDPEKIHALFRKGVFTRFYQVPVKQLSEFPGNAVVKNIFVKDGLAHCVVISRKSENLPYKEIALPKQSLSAMRHRLAEDKNAMFIIREEVRKIYEFCDEFHEVRNNLGKEIEFRQAIDGMGKSGALAFVSGFVPVDKIGVLAEQAKLKQWAHVINDPKEEDSVPTLIRNPKWVSIIKPVFKLLEIVPGYRELDISLFFLIFFSLFFGILIGDAGYGLLYLIITFLIERKIKKGKKVNTPQIDFFLFYVLSFCAIIWGLLTGSFFGQVWLTKTGFKPLLPALNDAKNMQSFCFFLGALHLTLAHSWRAILKFPSLAALADIGWVFVLWAAFFFAKLLILSSTLPFYANWLLIIGVTLVVFFTNPQKNILKTFGEGLGTLALSLMNNFTDVVSYVRLFAVGLAGVAIADTFNNMASGVGTGNIIGLLAGIFIIVAGHSLNLVLGPMSVLVHGVRLNVLEFSGHASVTWSGFAYKPLKD